MSDYTEERVSSSVMRICSIGGCITFIVIRRHKPGNERVIQRWGRVKRSNLQFQSDLWCDSFSKVGNVRRALLLVDGFVGKVLD